MSKSLKKKFKKGERASLNGKVGTGEKEEKGSECGTLEEKQECARKMACGPVLLQILFIGREKNDI